MGEEEVAAQIAEMHGARRAGSGSVRQGYSYVVRVDDGATDAVNVAQSAPYSRASVTVSRSRSERACAGCAVCAWQRAEPEERLAEAFADGNGAELSRLRVRLAEHERTHGAHADGVAA